MNEAAIRDALLALAAERAGRSFCPSEAARRVAPGDWRALMPAVRAVAVELQDAGELEASRRGAAVRADAPGGPVRLSPASGPPRRRGSSSG